ncbi:LysM peptidoglycan-binding domain-containing protein [Halanaerobacter jeridensis]|uniref:LysM domain-containing protein n=1 Tax=Halanaerobacter jeridensis TaxID=706427 RepID=A0A939BQC5_9FIRM|nr:hypothetical protein [Halanaerobacter jeridensis]MBM7558142.1 hypothetical protein [Halanaerobacter jeridensis]
MQNNNKRVYEVKKGDRLWDIAERELGDPTRWEEITKSDGSTFKKEEVENLQEGEILNLPPITHKELLTFSNLTNLEWQFVDIEGIIQSRKSGQQGENIQSTKLNDLLSDPKSFVSYNSVKKSYSYPYLKNKTGENINLTDEEKEKGLAEMRSKAGIAMEYLEKWTEEGNQKGKFIEDWEVIYGADNYKVVKDYIDQIQADANPNKSKEDLESIVPSREKVEQDKKTRAKIKAGFELGELVINVSILKGEVSSGKKIVEKKLLNESIDKISKGTATAAVQKVIKKINCTPLNILSLIYFNKGSKLEFAKAAEGLLKEETLQHFKEEGLISREELSEYLKKNSIVQVTQNIDMFKTEFKVVALKKGNTIVVSYQGKRPKDNKLLPEEFDYLQMVCDKLRRSGDYDEQSNIVFTGYEGGADLSFLNTLLMPNKSANATLFYNNLRELKDYMNFTPHDFNKEYTKNIKIDAKIKDMGKKVADYAVELALTTALIKTGIIGGTVTLGAGVIGIPIVMIAIGIILDLGMDSYDNSKLEEKYNSLKKLEYIKDEKSIAAKNLSPELPEHIRRMNKENNPGTIKGYIEDEFLYGEPRKLLVNNSKLISNDLLSEAGDTVKMKKDDALYFLFQKIEKIVDYNYKIEKKDYSTTVGSRKVDIEYVVYQEDIWGPEAAEFASLEMTEKTKLEVCWALGKNSQDHYEIKGILAYDPTPNDQVFDYLTPNKPLFLPLKSEIADKTLTEIIASISTTQDEDKKERLAYFKYQFYKVARKLKKDFDEHQMVMNLIEMIGIMQRKFLDKWQTSFEYIYPLTEGIKASNKLPSKSQLSKDKKEIRNEFAFMPYLQDDGNINRNNPQLHDEYIISVFKSMMQKHKERIEYSYYKSMSYNSTMFSAMAGTSSTVFSENAHSKVKYGLEKYKEEYSHEFEAKLTNVSEQKKEINQEFLQLIKRVQYRVMRSPSYDPAVVVFFNYYQQVFDLLEQDPQLVKKYYQLEEVNGHQDYPDATHVITIHPDYKNKIEYKYNPCDEIIGGELKLYITEEKEDKQAVKDNLDANSIPKTTTIERTKDSEKQKKKRENKKATGKSSPSPKFREKRKLLRGLNKKSSVEEIKEAAQIVISEARRKKKVIIAEMLEDYLSGMYNQKRVDDKKLRILDAVKTAEVELKLKIDKNLVWEINRRVFSNPDFEPGQRIKFDLKESILVNPYNGTIEEFLNPSKQSRLTVEADFELKKVLNRDKLDLRGKMIYTWKNNYRWLAGRKKLVSSYGYIDDYLFKKLADKRVAKTYKLYSNWDYYLEDSISLNSLGIDYSKHWYWKGFCICPQV